ncbi:cysteine peptidase family C39 domain-containing protein [Salinivirga cyanobacteriivorans]
MPCIAHWRENHFVVVYKIVKGLYSNLPRISHKYIKKKSKQ